jgi:dTDP-L-rhamnose 4-epimerase
MEPLLIDEATCRPANAYGVSKYAIELLASSLGTRYGISTACLRYSYVHGARNSFFNAYSGVCRIFALRILNGLPPICYEDGEQLGDYVNVADVARANVLAMEAEGAEQAVYNVGGGKGLTVLQFADIMLKACDSSLEPLVPGAFRVGDTRHTVSDISAIRSLGWQPTVKPEQSVDEYLGWMSRFKDTRAYLEEADRVMRDHGVIQSVAAAGR